MKCSAKRILRLGRPQLLSALTGSRCLATALLFSPAGRELEAGSPRSPSFPLPPEGLRCGLPTNGALCWPPLPCQFESKQLGNSVETWSTREALSPFPSAAKPGWPSSRRNGQVEPELLASAGSYQSAAPNSARTTRQRGLCNGTFETAGSDCDKTLTPFE